LLQWDRPISEQPESVKKALIDIGAVKSIDDGASMYRAGNKFIVDGGTKLGMRVFESETDAKEYLQAIAVNGQHAYKRAASVMGDKAASEALTSAGIPGIRYLDGMSRDGGKGTYNYVFFSEDGINLLERNGNPIEQFAQRRAGKSKPYRESLQGN